MTRVDIVSTFCFFIIVTIKDIEYLDFTYWWLRVQNTTLSYKRNASNNFISRPIETVSARERLHSFAHLRMVGSIPFLVIRRVPFVTGCSCSSTSSFFRRLLLKKDKLFFLFRDYLLIFFLKFILIMFAFTNDG